MQVNAIHVLIRVTASPTSDGREWVCGSKSHRVSRPQISSGQDLYQAVEQMMGRVCTNNLEIASYCVKYVVINTFFLTAQDGIHKLKLD